MKMGNIARGSFDFSKVEYIKPGTTPDEEHRLVYGDVLFNTRNTLELVGKVAIWRNKIPLAYYNSNLMRLEFNRDFISSNEFANYALNSKDVITRLRGLATGTTSVAAIYTRDLKLLQITIPPASEQKAIAQALCDIDDLIASLDVLIAKKRDIKQAAMQQLLTGKTRLPGFDGEWLSANFGSFGRFYGGLTGRAKGDFGHGTALYVPFVNVIQNTILDAFNLERVNIPSGESQNEVINGDLLFNGSSETPEEVAFACAVGKRIPQTTYLNSFCFGFRPKSDGNFHSPFWAYFFRGPLGRKLALELAQGSTRFNISKRAVSQAEVPAPPFSEQMAISKVLEDMDSELASLSIRRSKIVSMKEGMMQQLLTGRIRLV